MEILGRYALVDELSAGYLGPRRAGRVAADPDAPFVAIRCVELSDDPIARDRLSEAAFWAMEVTLASGPAATDVVSDGGRLGVVSPFHAGETLQTLIARAARQEIRAPAPVVLRIVSDLLADLARVARAAEEDPDAGYHVYGSVTPDSVLVGQDGRTDLLDVGVGAVASAFAPWNQRLERLAYDAPERAGSAVRVGGAADVFALGVLAWELIAGRRLFTGATAWEVTEALRHRTVPALDALVPGTDPSVAALVARTLARDPAARVPSAAELERAIAEVGVPPASRADVAAYVRGSAGRVSRAIARLSTRPPPPVPPPPLGALDAPAPLGADAVDADAPTREMIRPEEETPTREFEVPLDVFDELSAQDEVTDPDGVTEAIAASERERSTADADRGSEPDELVTPPVPVPTAMLAAMAAPPGDDADSSDEPAADSHTTETAEDSTAAAPPEEPTNEADPIEPAPPTADRPQASAAPPTPETARPETARAGLGLPLAAIAAVVLLAAVAFAFLRSSPSAPPRPAANVTATPAQSPRPASPSTPATEASNPTPEPAAAPSPAPEAAPEPGTPDASLPEPADEPAPEPVTEGATSETAPAAAAPEAPPRTRPKRRATKRKPFIPDDI